MSLIGSIYDAALDATLWPDTLAGIAEFVGGHGIGLLQKDSLSKATTPHHHTGVDPDFVRTYAETHSKFAPTSPLPFFDPGQVVSFYDLVPYDEFRAGRFFGEWMQPQGWVDAAGAVLEKSATGFSFISALFREPHGPIDDKVRSRMALIVPHVRRAVLIGKAVEAQGAKAAVFSDVIDRLGDALFLIGTEGRIVHVNAAGDVLLRAGEVLRAQGGRLVATNGAADASLREALAALGHGDAAAGTKGIAILLTGDGREPYVAHLLPVNSGDRRRVRQAAVTAVFVRKAAMPMPSAPEIIAKSYKLTPSELRVLLAIVDIGGIPEVAAALDVAETTVKTHVKRLFEKTGTNRQAELVKLVAGFSTPAAA